MKFSCALLALSVFHPTVWGTTAFSMQGPNVPAFCVRDSSSGSPVSKPVAWWTTAISTASIALVLSTATPVLAANANVANGATLFTANCASCHAGGGNNLAKKKTLEKQALEKYQSLDPVQLQKYMQTGLPHKLMPFKFEEQDYKDVTAFVLDQAMNEKW